MVGDCGGVVAVVGAEFLGDFEAEALVEGLGAGIFAGDVEYGYGSAEVAALLDDVFHELCADALSAEVLCDADVADVVHFDFWGREEVFGLECAPDDGGAFEEAVVFEDCFEAGYGVLGGDVVAEGFSCCDDGSFVNADDVAFVAEFSFWFYEGASEEFDGVYGGVV